MQMSVHTKDVVVRVGLGAVAWALVASLVTTPVAWAETDGRVGSGAAAGAEQAVDPAAGLDSASSAAGSQTPGEDSAAATAPEASASGPAASPAETPESETSVAASPQDAPLAEAEAAASVVIEAPADKTLDGTTITAYRLAGYADAHDADGDGRVDAVSVSSADAATDAWIAAALEAAGVKRGEGYDAAGAFAKLSQEAGSAATQRAVASALAKAREKPQAVVSDRALSGVKATLALPAEGLYLLVTPSATSMPIVVSTKIGGRDLKGAELGRVVLKSTAVEVDKKIVGEDGQTAKDSDTVTVGETRGFESRFAIPAEETSPERLVYEDVSEGMAYVEGSLEVTVAGTRAELEPRITDRGFSVDLSELIEGNWGKEVALAYRATVTAVGATNDARLTATLDGSEHEGHDEVTTGSFEIALKKVRLSDATPLSGAGFKLQDRETGAWLSWEATAKRWAFAKDEADASELTSDKDGKVGATSLGAGSYLLKETTVPDGMVRLVRPSLTVTVGEDGTVSISDESDPNLTDLDGGVVTVRNVDSLTQLPQTGDFMGGLMLAGSACLLAGGSVLGVAAVRGTGRRGHARPFRHLR